MIFSSASQSINSSRPDCEFRAHGVPTCIFQLTENAELIVMATSAGEILFLKKQDAIELQVIRNIRVCLLYTSPSPRDRQKSRMPSSA